MKYSIWLVPPEPVYSKLTTVIRNLANQYNAPIFEPHLTVLGDISQDLPTVIEKLTILQNKINPLEFTFGDISFSTTYFQSVFVQVKPTAALMQLYLETQSLFQKENTMVIPHFSLLYGNQTMAEREKIVKRVEPLTDTCLIDSFVITPYTADPKDWKHVAQVPFLK